VKVRTSVKVDPSLPRLGIVIIAVVLVALSARLSVTIPGSPLPQSAQTLAVVLVGALLGARDGSLAIGAYLLAGAAGVPVFADGASGWSHLIGPTAGYLAGFLLAAWGVGRLADRGRLRRLWPAALGMLAAHALILTLGWVRLTASLGPVAAFEGGVAPFVLGGIVKSLIAAGLAVGATVARGGRVRHVS